MQANTYTLKNGLRLILVDTEAFPSLTSLLLVGAGSRYENTKNNGIAHFFEHMAFKGSTKYPSAQVLAELIEGLGGVFNAFTSDDYTGYYVKAPAEDAATVVDVLGDMIQHPILDEKEMEKEKGVIVQEINMYEDMPGRTVYENFETLLYKDHPLGYKIIGTKETVTSAQRSTFTDYIDEWYHPNNAVMILAGGLSSYKKDLGYYKKIVENRFNSWESQEVPDVDAVKESQSSPEFHLEYKKSEQSHLVVGYRTFPRSDERRYIMAVLSTILGGGMSSRLFSEVREKRGLCYSVRSYAQYYEDAGYLATYIGVDPNVKNVMEAVRVTLDEHQKMAQKPVTDEELLRAKERIKGTTLLGLEDTFNVASMFGKKMLFENELMDLDDFTHKIEAVTADDIQKLAAELFVQDSLNMALIGPFKDEEVFDSILG